MPALLSLDFVQTLAAAGVVLFAGYAIQRRVGVLSRYNIPAPVVGGLLVAVLLTALRAAGHEAVRFDTTLQPPLMIAFFTSIGFGASVPLLRKGGPAVALFLALCLARGVSGQDPDLAGRLAAVERQLAALQAEREQERHAGVPPLATARPGLGPAGSKVYALDAGGVSFGGYGELTFGEVAGSVDEADALRAVLFLGHRFDERWVVFHRYITDEDANDLGFASADDPGFAQYRALGGANVFVLDLLTGVTRRITRMHPGQYALYPHFRSDSWIYFVVRDQTRTEGEASVAVEVVVASDAALMLEEAAP